MKIREKSECDFDVVSLGEVMLRLDPERVEFALLATLMPMKAAVNTTLLVVYENVLVFVERLLRHLQIMKLDVLLKTSCLQEA